MTVIKSVTLIPNRGVKYNKVRLRDCMAKKAASYAKINTIHPGELEARIKKDKPELYLQSVVIAAHTHHYQFGFEDRTKLIWLHEIGEYGIVYPPEVKVIFVPVDIPSYKERLPVLGTSEKDFVSMVINNANKPVASAISEEDEEIDRMIGLGCG